MLVLPLVVLILVLVATVCCCCGPVTGAVAGVVASSNRTPSAPARQASFRLARPALKRLAGYLDGQ